MNKFRKATKRIAAVGASAAVAISGVTAAGLSEYPSNFVEGGAFMGDVVVGANADPMDTASATALIDDLKSEFSGDSEKVKISYRKSASGGEEIEFADSGDTWNYGEWNQNVRSTSFDESDDSNVFSDDETFDNDYSDEDYSQELTFFDGAMIFEHALRDDEQDEISTHLYMEDTEIMNYTLSLDSSMDSIGTGTNGQQDDFVGEELEIMGTVFTITEIGFDTTLGIDRLTLIGGTNKLAVGEGESATVDVDGQSFTVKVISLDDDEVLLEVNGEAHTIDEYDTEKVAGVEVGVTEILSPDRDNSQGYAELIIGGVEVELEHGQQVRINDKDIDDINEDYAATTTFSGSGGDWDGFTVTYSLDEEILLDEGDSFEEFVFHAFNLVFEGTNDVEYSLVEVDANSEEVKIAGTTLDEHSYSEDVASLVNASPTSPVRLIGSSDDDPFLIGNFGSTALTNTSGSFNTALGILTVAPDTYSVGGSTTLNLSAYSTSVQGTLGGYVINHSTAGTNVIAVDLDEANGFRFLVGDEDEQELWESKTYTTSSDEADFTNILAENEDENDVNSDEIAAKLDELSTATAVNGSVSALTGLIDYIAFVDEVLIDLGATANADISAGTALIEYRLDSADANADDEPSDLTGSGFNITLGFDNDDDEFNLILTESQSAFDATLANGAEADTEKNDDDVQEFVTKYGTKVVYDNDEQTSVDIWTPDEQVEAMVYLVTGAGGSETGTVTVDAADAEAKKDELEDDGYTITGEEAMSSEEVDFDVTAPSLDSEVSGMDDMIVVGGPAVNSVAADLLGLDFPTFGSASGVSEGEGLIRFFEDSNSVLVYGYSKEDTEAAVDRLNNGGLSGSEERVN